MNTQQAIEMCNTAREEGWIAVKPGVWLNSSDGMKLGLEGWYPEQTAVVDYSTHPFWITTLDSDEPTPVDTPEELCSLLA